MFVHVFGRNRRSKLCRIPNSSLVGVSGFFKPLFWRYFDNRPFIRASPSKAVIVIILNFKKMYDFLTPTLFAISWPHWCTTVECVSSWELFCGMNSSLRDELEGIAHKDNGNLLF